MREAKIEFNKKTAFTFVVGLAMDDSYKMIEETGLMDISEGRELKPGDKFKVVVGDDFSKETTFGKQVQLNDKILINGEEFTVIGILKPAGNPGSGSAVYITLDQMRISFNEPSVISMMSVKIKPGTDINAVADNIMKDLRRSRDVKEGKEDFSVQSPQKTFESYLSILNVINLLLIGLASISLIVGAVGIANTMYTAVLERTREIGIMKSVGAKNSDILKIFLIESALVGLAGGIIGLLIGMGIGKLIELVLTQLLGSGFFTAYFPWYLTMGSLAFAVIIGTISGILPAKQAASLSPVEALRQ
jgi:putative ABC transport system permease protein